MLKPLELDGIDLTRNIDELNDQEFKMALSSMQVIGDKMLNQEFGADDVKILNKIMSLVSENPKTPAYYKIKNLLGF